MPELATAWVTLAISAQNMKRDVGRELDKIDDGAGKRLGRTIGRDLEREVGQGAQGAATQVKARLSERLGAEVGQVVGRSVGGALKGSMTAATKVGELALKAGLTGAAGVASIAIGGVGLALTKGFSRLKSIDDAKFKLMGLGNSAASVSQIMDSALASVKGTAFGLDDAATAAASAVAAGIQPGQNLTKYLTDVGDAAAIAGTSFEDMGSIFNKIQTSNKAYTDDLQQLSDRGLPIFTWLQKQYGVTGEALSKMVQDGKVDAVHFRQAIEDNISGAALKMGSSFSGSVDNAEAALGRLGAALLKPLFTNAAGGLGSITEGLDGLTTWVEAHQPEIIGFFTKVGVAAVSLAQDVIRSFGSMLQGVGQFSSGLGSLLDAFGVDNNLKTIGDNITGIGDKLITTAAGFDAAKDKIRTWGTAASNAALEAQSKIPGLAAALNSLQPKPINVSLNDNVTDKIPGLKAALNSLPDSKTINVSVSGQVSAPNTRVSTFDGVPDPTKIGPVSGLFGNSIAGGQKNPIPHRAGGGEVSGTGTATSDSILAWLSDGEHVWSAAEVQAAGGQDRVAQLRQLAASGQLTPEAIGQGTSSPGGVLPTGYSQKSFDAENRAIKARNDLEEKRQRLAELEAKGTATESQLLKARNDVAERERTVQSAESKAIDAKTVKQKDNSVDGSSLGESIFGGFLQGLGLDGSVFSDFTQWPNFKSGVALANFGGSLLQGAMGQDPSSGGGGFGIPGLDSLSGFLKPIGPQALNPIDPNTTAHGVGMGQAPGPSIINNGTIGMDPRALTQRADAHQNQAFRRSGLPAIRPGG